MEFDTALIDHYWHLGCHRRELPADGDYLRFDSAAGEIVLFNDAGNLVAFDNRCPHRGARLYVGDSGNQPATCAYHGWTYRRGELIVPGRERFDACQLAHAALRRFRIDWCGDFLFFAKQPRTDLSTQLGAFAATLESLSFNIAGRLDLNRYDYACYWPLAIENALEPCHIDAVHQDTLATLRLEAGENRFDGDNSAWYAPLGEARLNSRLAKLRRFFMIDDAYDGYMSLYLFPFTMISSTYGYSYSLQHFLPAADGARTHFTSRLYAAHATDPHASDLLGSFFDSTIRVNRQVFDEDHRICQRMPRDSWSMEPLRFAAAEEAKIDHFRASCRRFVATTAAAVARAPASADA